MADPDAGWYRDPTMRHTHRYWTGSEWSDHVADGGVTTMDTIPELDRRIPPAPEDLEPSPPPPPSVTVTQSSGSGSTVGWAVALLAVVALVIVLINLVGDGDDTTDTTAPAAVTTVVDDTATTVGG